VSIATRHGQRHLSRPDGRKAFSELQVPTNDDLVITDQAFLVTMEGEVKILWENKSPKVFDNIIGDEIRGSEKGIEPWPSQSD
jgi:hypothetical protein